MKSKIFVIALLAGALFNTSCSDNEETPVTVEKTDEKIENCYYAFNAANTELNWTSYKFMSKAPVGGTFNEINIDNPGKLNDPMAVIEQLSFSIPIASVETKNEDRNGKIARLFFGSMSNTENITGKVVSINDEKVTISIMMNDVNKELELDYSLENETFKFETVIDVVDWNGQEGITALNNECAELHTNTAEGETEPKLWSEVAISFKTTLSKTCD